VLRISPELKRRLRLLAQRLNGADPSRTTKLDEGIRVGEGEGAGFVGSSEKI
jgi:hypothetical protein